MSGPASEMHKLAHRGPGSLIVYRPVMDRPTFFTLTPQSSATEMCPHSCRSMAGMPSNMANKIPRKRFMRCPALARGASLRAALYLPALLIPYRQPSGRTLIAVRSRTDSWDGNCAGRVGSDVSRCLACRDFNCGRECAGSFEPQSCRGWARPKRLFIALESQKRYTVSGYWERNGNSSQVFAESTPGKILR